MKGLLVGLCLFVVTSSTLGCSGSSPPPNDQPEPEAGADAHPEASAEAGSDSGSDSGSEGGSDAASDAGSEGGSDAGSEGGSEGGSDGHAPEAAIAFSTPQTFAATAVGQTATQTLTLTNTGGATTGTLTLTLGGANQAAFVLSNDTCSKQTLAPATKCTVDVAFTPTAVGSDTATLDATDGTVSASAALDGSGTAASALAFATVPSFGQVVVGQTAAQTLKLTNSGTAATAAPTLAITSANKGAAAAMYTTSADTCTGKPIAAGGSCTVVVTFAPTAAGTETATLTATAGALAATASLTGVGETAAQLVVSGTPDFVSVVGQPAMQSFVVTNSGEQTSGPVTVALTGASQFQVQTNGCKGVDLTSAGGATPSCTVVVSFTAAAAGPVTASLGATATPGASATVALSGTSAAALTLSAAQPFAAVVGQKSTQTFTVTNTGGETSGAPKVTLAGSADFTKTADTCTGTALQGAGSNKNTCTIGVTFAPLDTKAQAATLTVAATPGTAPSVALTGTGTAAAVSFALAAGGTTLPGYFKYAGTAVGQTTSQTFTATNTGNAASTTLTASIVSGPFTIVKGSDDCTGKTLEAGKTCTFDVDFAPGTQVGPSAGQVSVDDTDVTDVLLTTLWGAGLSATAQLVTTIPSGAYGLPAALDLTKVYAFGTVTYPTTSAEEFTVTNYSTVAPSTALVVAADANASSDFTLKNGCTSAALTAYAGADPSCSYTVTFAPPQGAAATAQAASYGYSEGNVSLGTNAVTGTP